MRSHYINSLSGLDFRTI